MLIFFATHRAVHGGVQEPHHEQAGGKGHRSRHGTDHVHVALKASVEVHVPGVEDGLRETPLREIDRDVGGSECGLFAGRSGCDALLVGAQAGRRFRGLEHGRIPTEEGPGEASVVRIPALDPLVQRVEVR